MKDHRRLTDQERAVIERLLSVEFRDAEYFRAQIAAITVTGGCGCGCGSLNFSVDTETPPGLLRLHGTRARM